MIQNSRSPVVKSRISSSSGSTMSVEKRSLARTSTMSSLAYLTTRAPVSADRSIGNPHPAILPRSKKQPRSRYLWRNESREFIGMTPDWDSSRQRSRQNIQAFFKPERIECFLSLAVVVRVVGVEPVAAAIDVEVCDLGEFRSLDQELLLRQERCDQGDFRVVQVELTP